MHETTFTYDFMKDSQRTVNGWSTVLRHHPQTLTKVLRGVRADGKRGRFKTYRLATVRAAVERHEAKKASARGVSDELLTEKIRALTLANDIKAGVLMPVETVLRVHGRMLAQLDQHLEMKLVNELPSQVSGLEAGQIKLHGTKLAGELMAIWRQARKELE
jgi:hypothetical protein